MERWLERLRVDPLPALLDAGDETLAWRVRHDLLGERVDPEPLWALPAVTKMLRRQRPDGRWPYPRRRARSDTAYDLLATYEALLELVEKHGLDVRHPALGRAAEFVLGFQSGEGDLRGMYGNQYSPNYSAGIVAVLLEGGVRDARVDRVLDWLLRIRQDDGGWTIPFRTLRRPSSYNEAMLLERPLEPDRSRPSSHLVTGIVLRALAADPSRRGTRETLDAARLLGSRLFEPDRYQDRRAASYWEKLRYPFRWTDVVSALDAMLLAGVPASDPAIERGLGWLAERQGDDGLWHSGYEKAADPRIREWVAFAAARVFRRAAAA